MRPEPHNADGWTSNAMALMLTWSLQVLERLYRDQDRNLEDCMALGYAAGVVEAQRDESRRNVARQCEGWFSAEAFERPIAVNHVSDASGRVAAVCECCGRQSKFTEPNHKGEPELWEIGRGWSQAPYPADFEHDDGSVGSTYTCPSCNERLAAGESLKIREYLGRSA